MKRAFDLAFSLVVLLLSAPVLLVLFVLIWLADGAAPIYRATRVGQGNRDFAMLKLRTMCPGAEAAGGTSTSACDSRVTPLGIVLRRWKLDELPQFWNVLRGEMSVVGPRPNTRRGGVDRYTAEELRLLTVKPGITDLSSIVFSDEAEILRGAADPDALYDEVIRPWKSQLGLLYVEHGSRADDVRIVWLTMVGMLAKSAALRGVDAILERWRADDELRGVCRRTSAVPMREAPRLTA